MNGSLEHLGSINAWFNNAGLGGNGLITELADEDWSRVIDVTLAGTFRCLKAVLPHFYSQGHGAVVNNASVLGWRAQEKQAHYAAAKAGVMALTRSAAIRSGRVQRQGERRSPQPRNAPEPGQGDTSGASRGVDLQGERHRQSSRTMGGCQRDGLPCKRPVRVLTGEVISVSSQHP